ncbi:MAG: hypothetical protein HZB29_12845 [Nitrospinae bacterium]|nr:hypothetical protein [Nitrospinota bacterium]
MKTMSVSIDEGLYKQLKQAAGQRGMSGFITEAVREKLGGKQKSLLDEYKAASRDHKRKAVEKDWAAIETEGWD